MHLLLLRAHCSICQVPAPILFGPFTFSSLIVFPSLSLLCSHLSHPLSLSIGLDCLCQR
ncbi:hypothetical protein YC2023_000657 [Brassica napus]